MWIYQINKYRFYHQGKLQLLIPNRNLTFLIHLRCLHMTNLSVLWFFMGKGILSKFWILIWRISYSFFRDWPIFGHFGYFHPPIPSSIYSIFIDSISILYTVWFLKNCLTQTWARIIFNLKHTLPEIMCLKGFFRYLIGQNFGGQKLSADKIFRRTKFSAPTWNFGNFVRRKFFIKFLNKKKMF